MSVAAVINNLLGHLGYRIVRTKTSVPIGRAMPGSPEQASTPKPSATETAAAVLNEIYQNRLDISAAVITALKDIRVTAQIAAGQSSAAWIASHADKVDAYPTRHDMLDQLCKRNLPPGDLAEFGVFTGAVTRFLRPRFPTRAYHAFDSFKGVPESMGLSIRAGDFTLDGAIPELPEGVTTHAGWFEDTVPKFCQLYPIRLALVYIDCDLYESVRTVLENLHDRLAAGAIVVFDDWYNFPNWQSHSRRALQELTERTGATFVPIGVTIREHAVAFRYDGAASLTPVPQEPARDQ